MPRQKHQTGLNLVQYGDGRITKKYEEVMKKIYANKRGNVAKLQLQLQLQVGRLLYFPFLQPPIHPEKVVLSSNFCLNCNSNLNPNLKLNLNPNLNPNLNTNLNLNLN